MLYRGNVCASRSKSSLLWIVDFAFFPCKFMATSSKIRPASWRAENSKLEQDIVDMESALQQQRARLAGNSSASKQTSKASGHSTWASGARGALSGYRSHKALARDQGVTDRASGDPDKLFTRSKRPSKPRLRGRTQSFTSVPETGSVPAAQDDAPGGALSVTTGGREPAKGSSSNNRVRSAPVRRGHLTMAERKAQHVRALSQQGGVKTNALHHHQRPQKTSAGERRPPSGKLGRSGRERRVSFDLSDEGDSQPASSSSREPVSDRAEPAIRVVGTAAEVGAVTPEAGSYVERIAQLKARVLAKAGAHLQAPGPDDAGPERQNGSYRGQSATYRIGRKERSSRPSSIPSAGVLPSRPQAGARNRPAAKKPEAKGAGESSKKSGTARHLDGARTAGSPAEEKDRADGDGSSPDFYFDADVELWLCSLELADSLECAKVLRRGRVTMAGLGSLTEPQLVRMGVPAGDSLEKILRGIRRLGESPRRSAGGESGSRTSGRRRDAGSVHTTRLSELMDDDRSEEPLDLKESSPTNPSPELPPAWAQESHRAAVDQSLMPFTADTGRGRKATDRLEDGAGDAAGPESPLKAPDGKSRGERASPAKAKPPRRGRALSADVVNRTLTSGVQSAMTKLKQKQEQELNEQRRRDRLRRSQRAERDKMALLHAQRQQERLDQMQAEEGEGRVGVAGGPEEEEEEAASSSSPETSVTFHPRPEDTIEMSVQGGGLLTNLCPSPSSPSDGEETVVLPSSDTVLSPRLTPEDRLKHLELKIQGLQGSEAPATVASEVEKLQRELASLRRDLTTAQSAISASAEQSRTSSRAQSAGSNKGMTSFSLSSSSPGPSRGVFTSMSRHELMKEVRKQKEQHKKQIRMLESELSRLKHRDPVQKCELPASDILYRQEDLIGEGTFSQVFRGSFNSSEVAIKRLKHPLDAADHNYFAEEVSLLHELRHPRVILLLGVCTSDRRPLMVLEYMAGGSLYARLHDKTRESLDHVAFYQIARDTALGMNYLHRHRPQVLHLDLKSMNVLLGLHSRAKIGDFGFAKLRHDAQAVEKGKVQGTPGWMAPELMGNSTGSLTDKVDVYSFGIILWEMYTGQQPYKGLSLFQVFDAVQKKKRPEIPESCPQPLVKLIQTCWDQKPNKRPSFKDILALLESLALPGEWQSLLAAANIPREAMEDPTSARSVIAMVEGSVRMTQQELDRLALACRQRAADFGGREEEVEEALAPLLGMAAVAESQSGSSVLYDSLNDAQRPPRLMSEAAADSLSVEGEGLSGKTSARPAEAEPPRVGAVPAPPPILPGALADIAARRPRPAPAPTTGPPASRPGPRRRAGHPGTAGHQSLDPAALAEQRGRLKATQAGPHPSQLPSLAEIGNQKMTSIAEILKKAVAARRAALREESNSLEHSLPESMWSATTDDY